MLKIWCVSLHQVTQSVMAQNALTKGMTEGYLPLSHVLQFSTKNDAYNTKYPEAYQQLHTL
jgi:hypothetical protein